MPAPRPRAEDVSEQTVMPELQSPVGQITARATPEAFGGQIGGALRQVGAEGENLGNQTAGTAIYLQGLLNETMATNAETSYMKQLGDVMGQYRTKEGLDAVAAWPGVQSQIQSLRQQVAQTLPNAMAQRAFNMLAQRHEGYAFTDGSGYASQQAKKANSDAAAASIQAEISNAGNLGVAGDDNRFGQVLGRIMHSNMVRLQNAGYGPGMTQDGTTGEIGFTDDDKGRQAKAVWDAEQDRTIGAAWDTRLHVLADQNPMQAYKLFNDNRSSIPGETAAKLDAFFYPKVRGAQLTGGANAFMQDLKTQFGNGGYGAPGTETGGRRPFSEVPAAKALPVIEQNESGGQNIYNYRHDERPSYYTAGGFYQITDTTWRDGAARAGVDLAQYPTAISAPRDVQTKVATALYNQYGAQPWLGNPKTVAALTSMSGGQTAIPAQIGGTPGTITRYTPPADVLPAREPLRQSDADFYRSNYAQIMDRAERTAEAQWSDDPVMQQAFVQKVRTQIDSAITAQRLQYEGDGRLITQALNKAIAAGQTPKSLDDLGQNDPQLKDAIDRFSYMNPYGYAALNGKTLASAAREDPDSKKYGPDYWKVRDMVFPRDGSDPKITDPMALNQFVGPGSGLFLAGLKDLQEEMQHKKDQPGVQGDLSAAVKLLHDRMSNQDETGTVKIKDPVGEQIALQLTAQFKGDFWKAIAAGKTSTELLSTDPSSLVNQYLQAGTRMRSEADAAAQKVNAPTETLATTENAGAAMGATGELPTAAVAPSKFPQGLSEKSSPEDILDWYNNLPTPTLADYKQMRQLIRESPGGLDFVRWLATKKQNEPAAAR